MKITQIWKNSEWTGLSNVVSYLYSSKNPNEKLELLFETDEWLKSITVYWKVKGTQKGYSYIVPKIVSRTNKDEEYFTTKQDLFLPAVTGTLFQMWFKDKINNFVKDSREATKITAYLNISEDTWIDEILRKKEDLEKKLKDVKKSLADKRYKLSLISNVLFLNWFSWTLNYTKWEDWKEEIDEKSKAKGVVWGVKKARVISSKDWIINIRIQLFKTEELV